MRYWRPLMLTLTWAMGEFPLPPPYPPPRAGEGREAGSIPVGCNDVPDCAHRLLEPAPSERYPVALRHAFPGARRPYPLPAPPAGAQGGGGSLRDTRAIDCATGTHACRR